MTIDPFLCWSWAIVTGALAAGLLSCLIYISYHPEQ